MSYKQQAPILRCQAAARSRALKRGAILTQAAVRKAYSTAACLYQIMPQAVAYPTDEENLGEIMAEARSRGLPVTPRGGGSGLVGNAVGGGLVLDFQPFMKRIIAVDVEKRTATVEPGLFLGDLNRALEQQGLWFPVEPSSADFATVGGIAASNAGGARSVKYGSLVHLLEGVRGRFADGARFEWSRSAGLSATPEWHQRMDALQRKLARSAQRDPPPAPTVGKIASGYRLELTDYSKKNLAGLLPLLAGSEGTLAVFSSITLRLVKRPAARRTAMLFFATLDAAAKAVPPLLLHRPAALELLDETAIRLALKFNPALRRDFSGDEQAVVLLEMEGAGEGEASDRLRDAIEEVKHSGIRVTSRLPASPAASEKIWNLRKITSPIVHKGCAGKKGLRFIEDGVVPPARVPEFIRGVKALCKKKSVEAVFFGHLGSGNIHINPFVDPHSRADFERMKYLYAGFSDLVISLGGALSGEHGDGRLRSREWNRRNKKLSALYTEVKNAFDPDNFLNPGIKASPSETPLQHYKYRLSKA
jgi:FAD/FMN-containing dehydrogenase